MKKLFLLLMMAVVLHGIGFGQTKYWQQQVNYDITVSLNDTDHVLDGFVRMEYTNNSPDTLHYIWIHLWPNAYKNDRTAFSDQLLENGRTDFYFSNPEDRGYINRLDFKVNDDEAKLEDHPVHQDIAKLVLPSPLVPHSACTIATPFHVKLPKNFSRGGHIGQAYQITQWYPKPAVYDHKGWHPMPYLDQGEFYSDFGNYKVALTLPANYIVASTGVLQDETLLKKLLEKKLPVAKPVAPKKVVKPGMPIRKIAATPIPSSTDMLTWHFQQDNVHDFAWFADKSFVVDHDTLKLTSGKTIDVFSFHHEKSASLWQRSNAFTKNSIRTRSTWLGEYPYNTVSVVEAQLGFPGGMEYPTITSISPVTDEAALEGVIEHEVGHNWNYGILASNERDHPWMDEGINTYFDNRYDNGYNIVKTDTVKKELFSNRFPTNAGRWFYQTLASFKRDQPIETTSEKFSELNYNGVAYAKTADWLSLLERRLGKTTFDSCLHLYYQRWQFRHPYPEDFKKVIEAVSGQNVDAEFSLLSTKGLIDSVPKKPLKLTPFFSFKDTDKYRYIFAMPAVGYNFYDKAMIGVLIHNYTLPTTPFQFLVAPLYGTGSKQLNGLGRVSYSWYPGNKGQKFEIALAGESFSGNSFTDSSGFKKLLRFSKMAPSIKYVFAPKDPRSKTTRFLQWKTFFIREQGLLFSRDTVNQQDIITYPGSSRYINQLRYVVENNRVLYPYNAEFKAEQGESFVRLAVTGNYFFNYPKGGGVNVRVFAGKFFYLGDKTFLKQFETDPYHLNMSGPKGYEDYTYSNYFFGRNEFEKLSSQQIMNRDGFFKVRTDLLSNKIGKTDNWLASVNFTTDVPDKINPLKVLPIKLPLKIFVDLGSYAEAWQDDPPSGKLLYDAGLQLSLFHDVLNVYVPILYSKVYRNYFNSTITENRFVKNISFSIDIQNLRLNKIIPQLSF